jgi:hypothetical protein
MIPLMIYSQFIVQPPDQSRSQAAVYQNDTPKKIKLNTMKIMSNISNASQFFNTFGLD